MIQISFTYNTDYIKPLKGIISENQFFSMPENASSQRLQKAPFHVQTTT